MFHTGYSPQGRIQRGGYLLVKIWGREHPKLLSGLTNKTLLVGRLIVDYRLCHTKSQRVNRMGPLNQ